MYFADRKFNIAGIEIFDLFAPATLTLTRTYTNLTRILWWYIGCANMNLLRQGFRKLSSEKNRQTNGQKDTTEII